MDGNSRSKTQSQSTRCWDALCTRHCSRAVISSKPGRSSRTEDWPRIVGSNMAPCERRSCWILCCQRRAIGRIYETMERSRHTSERASKDQLDRGRRGSCWSWHSPGTKLVPRRGPPVRNVAIGRIHETVERLRHTPGPESHESVQGIRRTSHQHEGRAAQKRKAECLARGQPVGHF